MPMDVITLERANFSALRRALLAWYRRQARDLPWRRSKDPYQVWLSEIILQQTRVEQGLPYYERFLAAFPTVHDLAAAQEDQVLKLWEGLGYYTRARNLFRAARCIVEEGGGAFPRAAAEWQQLPGVGRYTSGAIASIAFNERAPVLDGNVIRVLTRLYDISFCVDTPSVREMLWELAAALVPRTRPGDFNQGLMELGACICRPVSPVCADCPVRRFCKAFEHGVQGLRPVRRKKRRIPHQEWVAAIICKNGRYLLGKRGPGFLGGLWEFPCCAILDGESHTAAVQRLFDDMLGIQGEPGTHLTAVHHAYSHFTVTMHAYTCTWVSGKPKNGEYVAFRWLLPREFGRYAMPKVHRDVQLSLTANEHD